MVQSYIASFVFGSRVLVVPFERGGTKSAIFLATENVSSSPILVPQFAQW